MGSVEFRPSLLAIGYPLLVNAERRMSNARRRARSSRVQLLASAKLIL